MQNPIYFALNVNSLPQLLSRHNAPRFPIANDTRGWTDLTLTWYLYGLVC